MATLIRQDDWKDEAAENVRLLREGIACVKSHGAKFDGRAVNTSDTTRAKEENFCEIVKQQLTLQAVPAHHMEMEDLCS